MQLGRCVLIIFHERDKGLADNLGEHLEIAKRLGSITSWRDHQLVPGNKRRSEVSVYFKKVGIVVLLLFSPSFMASESYPVVMKQVMERHQAGDALVIPVLVRPVLLGDSLVGDLQALPRNSKPVTKWSDRDEAFIDVIKGLLEAIREWNEEAS